MIDIDGIGQPGMTAGAITPNAGALMNFVRYRRYTVMNVGQAAIPGIRDVRILDLSFWQGSEVNFVAIKNAGVQGVILRAGQNTWEDPEFQNNRAKAEAAGLPWGSYWFFDSRSRPQDQADRWANILGGNYGQLSHNGDYEEQYGGAYGGWVNYWHLMKNEVDPYGGGFQYLTGLPDDRLGTYTGFWYAQMPGKMPTNPESLAWFAKKPLWLAYYTTDPSIVKVPNPWLPEFPSLVLWQWSANGLVDGVSGNVDENWFNSNLTNYRAFYKLDGDPTPPPPTDPPSMSGFTAVLDFSDAGEVSGSWASKAQ